MNNIVKGLVPKFKREMLISAYMESGVGVQITTLFNNTGRTVSFSNLGPAQGFLLSGAYAPYFATLNGTFEGGSIETDVGIGMNPNAIGYQFDEPNVFVSESTLDSEDTPIFIKFEIYE